MVNFQRILKSKPVLENIEKNKRILVWVRFDENLDLPHGLGRKHHQSTPNHKMRMPLTHVLTQP